MFIITSGKQYTKENKSSKFHCPDTTVAIFFSFPSFLLWVEFKYLVLLLLKFRVMKEKMERSDDVTKKIDQQSNSLEGNTCKINYRQRDQ